MVPSSVDNDDDASPHRFSHHDVQVWYGLDAFGHVSCLSCSISPGRSVSDNQYVPQDKFSLTRSMSNVRNAPLKVPINRKQRTKKKATSTHMRRRRTDRTTLWRFLRRLVLNNRLVTSWLPQQLPHRDVATPLWWYRTVRVRTLVRSQVNPSLDHGGCGPKTERQRAWSDRSVIGATI